VGANGPPLATVVTAALADSGATLDNLTASEAVELADVLPARDTLAVLETPTPVPCRCTSLPPWTPPLP
jgi:hypothetical protein